MNDKLTPYFVRGKGEILDDITRGQVPTTVTSFAELHDWVEANEYCGFCDEDRNVVCGCPDDDKPCLCGAELRIAEVGEIQQALDAWLKSRKPVWLDEWDESYRPDPCVLELLQLPGVVDESWHHDVCPHFAFYLGEDQERYIGLWFENPDPAKRERSDAPRYMVNLNNNSPLGFESLDIIVTDDPLAAVNRFLMFAMAPERMTKLALLEISRSEQEDK
jgi:hypothetical protein